MIGFFISLAVVAGVCGVLAGLGALVRRCGPSVAVPVADSELSQPPPIPLSTYDRDKQRQLARERFRSEYPGLEARMGGRVERKP